jgi:hypothetical protein
MTTHVWKSVVAVFVAGVFLMALGCKKKEEAPAKKEDKPKVEPRPREEPPPRKVEPRPRKVEPPKMEWAPIKSEKYGVQFELPKVLVVQTDEKEYVFAWDKAGTVFFAAGAVKNLKKAEKGILKILKKLKVKLVKWEGWKDFEHNGMKGKHTTGALKTAKGADVKGLAAVFQVAKKKTVAFMLLYPPAKEKEFAPHIKRIQRSIKPLGAAAPAKKDAKADPKAAKKDAKAAKKPDKKGK